MRLCAFLTTDEGVLVVDSGNSPDYGRAVVEAVGRTIRRPIRFLVLTNSHADHTFGAGAFPAGTLVIAHASLAVSRDALRKSLLDLYPPEIARLRGEVESLKREGRPGAYQPGGPASRPPVVFAIKRNQELRVVVNARTDENALRTNGPGLEVPTATFRAP